ncbi:DUF2589 domain-containing protein [Pseudoalteromonas luteoviolacea]|uniref:DUF2589 domain-containing protein n=1 Tax=Pseudoalteromonas luteoviolacea DSM 6061 TaxID=1365250 RepID=A0A166WCP0_9GAMM|nr:DUF2589 domain-containing protein [Pseudoalteromonas luteoviolacea]KZN37141.1 hypothetical protein N475_17135 [Pseudoalteromonas luteoviolacea DSM 6061]MBE0389530.1 hypothetical protein [Pseudoalteromonas luteoviolacea DSM 6061]TQF67829.1 DUF2589 domain-containing protein [Pseudoalteromonas luteoviolacea]
MIEFQSLMKAIHKGVKDAAKSVEGETIDFVKRFFDEHENEAGLPPSYSPKTCTMQFPSRSEDGIDTIEAQVPLLALVPISSPRITEVKFKTDLEISTNEHHKLMVTFAKNTQKTGLRDKIMGPHSGENTANAHLEIVMTGHEPPEGLKKLIEGYERALRAQIPG